LKCYTAVTTGGKRNGMDKGNLRCAWLYRISYHRKYHCKWRGTSCLRIPILFSVSSRYSQGFYHGNNSSFYMGSFSMQRRFAERPK